MRRHLHRNGDVAVAKDLDRAPFAHGASCHELVDADRAALGKQRLQCGQVDDLVLDLVGVLEAAKLGQPHVQRHLPALEVGRHLVAGLGALGAAASGLALRALAASHASLRSPGTGCWTQVVNFERHVSRPPRR